MKFWLILGHISSIIIALNIGAAGFIVSIMCGDNPNTTVGGASCKLPMIIAILLGVGIIACSSFSWQLYYSHSKIKQIIGKIFIFFPLGVFLLYILWFSFSYFI